MGSINRNIRSKKSYKNTDVKKHLKPVYDYKEKSYLDKNSVSYLNQIFENAHKPLTEIKVDIENKLRIETQELDYLIKKVCGVKKTNAGYNILTNN